MDGTTMLVNDKGFFTVPTAKLKEFFALSTKEQDKYLLLKDNTAYPSA